MSKDWKANRLIIIKIINPNTNSCEELWCNLVTMRGHKAHSIMILSIITHP